MNHPADPDRTRLDPYPAAEPPPPRMAPDPVLEEEGIVDADDRRRRTVTIVNTVIRVICGLFAVVLALHILLVIGEANQGNGFASMINSWSSAVSLGLRDLFVPDDPKVATFLNDGLAAIAWLAIAALLTFLIRRFALPGPRRVSHYRRTVR
jgi:hypothetical protein